MVKTDRNMIVINAVCSNIVQNQVLKFQTKAEKSILRPDHFSILNTGGHHYFNLRYAEKFGHSTEVSGTVGIVSYWYSRKYTIRTGTMQTSPTIGACQYTDTSILSYER